MGLRCVGHGGSAFHFARLKLLREGLGQRLRSEEVIQAPVRRSHDPKY